jgi:FkbM family methyltransferase
MKLFDRFQRLFKGNYDRSVLREPLFLEMLKYGLGSGPVTMIDVGSNDGVEAIYAMQLGITGLHVHLIEPDAGNLERCARNVRKAIGAQAPMTFSNFAVSNFDGDGVFYRNAKASHLNSASRTECANIEVPVRYITLESYILQQQITGPILVKMDIEGHEVEVLEHFTRFAASHGAISVLLEVHPATYTEEHSLERVFSEYLAHGFHPKLVESAGMPQPGVFRERGLEPIMVSGRRGLYRDIDPELFLRAACHEQEGEVDQAGTVHKKSIRSVLIQKP